MDFLEFSKEQIYSQKFKTASECVRPHFLQPLTRSKTWQPFFTQFKLPVDRPEQDLCRTVVTRRCSRAHKSADVQTFLLPYSACSKPTSYMNIGNFSLTHSPKVERGSTAPRILNLGNLNWVVSVTQCRLWPGQTGPQGPLNRGIVVRLPAGARDTFISSLKCPEVMWDPFRILLNGHGDQEAGEWSRS
jgi:hypothetical protein